MEQQAVMEQVIVDFENWLRLKRSASTVMAYGWQLRRLAREFPTFGPRDYRERDLTHYLAERKFQDEWGDSCMKLAACALRVFFEWAVGRKSPAARLPVKRVRPRRQRSLTREQLGAVLAACDTSTRRGKRDAALVGLMVDSGLRASEVCRLRLGDVDLAALRFVVVIKGGGEEAGSFTPETRALLDAWLSVRGECPKADTFFLNVGGGKSAALTPSGLRVIFRGLGRAAGLPAFSPHDLRRTFATLTIKAGGSSRLVQIGGRWHELAMVERYTPGLELEDLARFLPMSGMLGLESRRPPSGRLGHRER